MMTENIPFLQTRRDRRALLKALASAGAISACPRTFYAQPGAGPSRITLSVHAGDTLAHVPATYTGLSYETAQLTHETFFSAENVQLIHLCRTLGTSGVLRIGGNTSAFTTFVPTGGDPNALGYGPDRGTQASRQYPGMYKITPKAIDNLRAFLDQTGWQLLYGLNLRHGTPESGVEEAAYVAKVCGAKLVALQFGNEPDLFRDDPGPDGKDGPIWGFDKFITRWKAMYAAVHARLPGVKIAGPDSAYRKDWAGRFAQETKGEISLLTTHYYAEGPPTDPRMTIDFLLHPGEKIQTSIYDAMAAAKAAGLPYRMSEGNSCYQGGKPGVSNTFASALWAGDFMLDLAARGATGVNLHGGGQGVYTPIATDSSGNASARPDFYGMWMAGQFANATMVRTDIKASTGMDLPKANVTAYAARHEGGMLVAVFNKGGDVLEIALEGAPGRGDVYRMKAPALDSTTGVTFGRGTRSADAVWTLGADETLHGKTLALPAASAVLLRLM
jgi:hypothetical protein